MSADSNSSGGWLGRWSRVKREATREKGIATETPRVEPKAPPPAATPEKVATAAAAPSDAVREDALPPVESLTMDSDFSAFLKPKVDETLKRQALRQLFRDPHFNVMDGLDVYIDDYSKPDPIDPDVVRQMVQGRYIFDPPQTRINAQGFVEDVPPEESVPPLAGPVPEALPPAAPSDADAVALTPAGEQSASSPASAEPSEVDADPAASRPPVDPPSSVR